MDCELLALRHIVTSQVEHSSVLNYCIALEKASCRTPLLYQEGCRGGRPKEDGYRVTYLPVDRDGLLKLADLEAAITDETAVVSLMWANNETGVLFPVERIAEICRSRGVLYHCDAVQAAGKVEIDVQDSGGLPFADGPQISCAERDWRAVYPSQSAIHALRLRRASGAQPARRYGERAADSRHGEGRRTGPQILAEL